MIWALWIAVSLAAVSFFGMLRADRKCREKEHTVADLTIRLSAARVDLSLAERTRNKALRALDRRHAEDTKPKHGRTLPELGAMFHERSVKAGFWPEWMQHENPPVIKPPEYDRWISQQLMLIGDELSEAHEALRDGKIKRYADPRTGKPEGMETELSDALIRLLDLGEGLGLDLETAMLEKHKYNLTRPAKHGRRF